MSLPPVNFQLRPFPPICSPGTMEAGMEHFVKLQSFGKVPKYVPWQTMEYAAMYIEIQHCSKFTPCCTVEYALDAQVQCQDMGVPVGGPGAQISAGHHPHCPVVQHPGLPAHRPGQDADCCCGYAQLHALVSPGRLACLQAAPAEPPLQPPSMPLQLRATMSILVQ